MVQYLCKKCNFSTKRKNDYNRHLKTQKHLGDKIIKKFICACGKKYKSRSGLWRHNKICNGNIELKNIKLEIEKLKSNYTFVANQLLESNKTNTELIKEVKNLKKENKNQIVKQNITNNNIQNVQNVQNNISINVFLNEHCQNAMSLTDFVNNLQITFDDLKYTGKTNYVEGISNILIKNLNKMDKLERPIHCSDVKRKVLYIKNDDGWEKDKQHKKITRCIKDVEYMQIKKIPEWTKEENIDIYKSDHQGMKYQKVIFNSMGGMNNVKREKNKTNVIKTLSEKTDYKI
tara:strand:+ start:410 stop:1276 length:867 start_codon:yes stop_codon:yes gene_type:complete